MRADFQPLEILWPRTLGRYFVPVSSRGATCPCRESAALRDLNGSDGCGPRKRHPSTATRIGTASSSYQKLPRRKKCSEAWVRPSALGKNRGWGADAVGRKDRRATRPDGRPPPSAAAWHRSAEPGVQGH
jgi:hypothetical protein